MRLRCAIGKRWRVWVWHINPQSWMDDHPQIWLYMLYNPTLDPGTYDPLRLEGTCFINIEMHGNSIIFHEWRVWCIIFFHIFFPSTTCMTSNTAILWSCFRHHDCVGTELEATKTYLKPKCSSLVLTNVVTGRNNRIFAGHCAQELFFQKCCQQWDQISAFFLWWVSLRESLQHITGLVGLVWLWFIPDCYIIYIYLSHP